MYLFVFKCISVYLNISLCTFLCLSQSQHLSYYYIASFVHRSFSFSLSLPSLSLAHYLSYLSLFPFNSFPYYLTNQQLSLIAGHLLAGIFPALLLSTPLPPSFRSFLSSCLPPTRSLVASHVVGVNNFQMPRPSIWLILS